MRQLLVLLTALTALFAQSAAMPSVASPTLDVTDDAVTISCGEQRLTVSFSDASLRFETPCGGGDLIAAIDTPDGGFVRPSKATAPPKVHRGKDSVASLIAFPVPDGRQLMLHVDAYPGIEAIFVTSSLSAGLNGTRDSYSWNWSEVVDSCTMPGANGQMQTRIIRKGEGLSCRDWAYFPRGTGGIALLTSGMIGSKAGRPCVNALPRSRFLRPGETLDIGLGLSSVSAAEGASDLFMLARAKSVPALKRFRQAKIDYGKPAPAWLRTAGADGKWSDDEAVIGSLQVVSAPSSQAAIEKAHEAGRRVIVSVNVTQLQSSDADKHPDWLCVDAEGRPARSQARGGSGLSFACYHQPDLREAALSQVCGIMDLGADGIFLDRATPAPECSGAKIEKHTHPDPGKTNNAMFEQLAREIYALVKTFGEDKVVIQNSGILPARWSYCDAQAGELANDPSGLQQPAEEHAGAVRAGKVLLRHN